MIKWALLDLARHTSLLSARATNSSHWLTAMAFPIVNRLTQRPHAVICLGGAWPRAFDAAAEVQCIRAHGPS